jgi:hypothetical protein
MAFVSALLFKQLSSLSTSSALVHLLTAKSIWTNATRTLHSHYKTYLFAPRDRRFILSSPHPSYTPSGIIVTMSSAARTQILDMDSLLTGPTPDNVTVQPIDFAQTSLSKEYSPCYAVVLDNVLTRAECNDLVAAAEQVGNGNWERALVNIGGGRQALITDTRSCGRIIWDNQEIVDRLWNRCEPFLRGANESDANGGLKGEVLEDGVRILVRRPDITGSGPVKRGETWRMTRLNERMRFLRYEGGEYFRREFSSPPPKPPFRTRATYSLTL